MAGFDAGIKVFFGGDTSQLKSSLNEANGLVDSFTKTVKKAGIDLGKGFGLGVLIFQAKQFFDAVINDAQKTRDAFEDMGKPIPASIASVAKLGDAIDNLKKGAIDLGTTFLSFFTKAGEGWGMLINRIRGVSAEQEKLYEKISRDADKAEKERDKAAQNADSKRKQREAEAQRDAEAAAREREKRLDNEYDQLVKVGNAEIDLAAKRAKSAHEQLSLSDKVADSEKSLAAIEQQIFDYKKNGVLSSNDQLKVIELENQKLEITKQLYEERKDLAEKTKLTEEEIIKRLVAQKNAIISIQGIRGGNQFNEATDETLADVARRNRSKAQQIGAGIGGYGIGQNLEKARLESEAMNAERELRFRNEIRQNNAIGGREYARSRFEGDPLLFDRVFDQIVRGQDVQEQTRDYLKDIRDYAKRGIPVVFQGGNT